MSDVIVCLCCGTSESDIRLAIRAGARTFCAIIEGNIAGTGCGGCHPQLLELLEVENKPEELSDDQVCDFIVE